jgi:hypothetical protein
MKLGSKRARRCSFCGEPETKVEKLLGGASGYICDVCVGVCNSILDTVPCGFAGWDSLTDERLLEALRPAAATVDACRDVLQTQVRVLRERDVSWTAIGSALGISRQAAWERFS